ncbi:hypothetical protein CSKR_202205 [Clonorchis sinensis]|uniref:Uncharacterized protein n=1 Tax=Clonorchis sinensis TaxID=79923 RepID=A0A8T1LXI8_CLOSI|nr:hypothetical protein CSKR_202205 [Clonorchis sinensis]
MACRVIDTFLVDHSSSRLFSHFVLFCFVSFLLTTQCLDSLVFCHPQPTSSSPVAEIYSVNTCREPTCPIASPAAFAPRPNESVEEPPLSSILFVNRFQSMWKHKSCAPRPPQTCLKLTRYPSF